MTCRSQLTIAVILSWLLAAGAAFGILPSTTRMTTSSHPRYDITSLGMKKNLRNKQQELKRKMEQAKQQKKGPPDDAPKPGPSSDSAEIKKRNDRLRFEELLERESANVLNAYSKDGYLSKEQEEEEINAAKSGIDRLFEGDPAPSEPFEELISFKSENAIGKAGAARLVPWLRKNADRRGEFLIVLTDPRMKSAELRQTIKNLGFDLSSDLLNKLIVINADSPAENRRWLKKNSVENIEVYSDEKMEWMRAYTALGEKRFSMCMFILADERVQKLARDVDGIEAGRVIKNAVKLLDLPSL